MARFLLVLCLAALCVPVCAQVTSTGAYEPMWIANRNSKDVSKISLAGEVLGTVNLGTDLRRLKVAPDGKIWVIRFIQSTFDILNPDGTLFLTVSSPVGSPYDVDFDRNGHAWMTGGGSSVQEYDKNGNPVNSAIGPPSTVPYLLPAGSALGVTVDADGNKWIAHRVGPPGSVSRIDGLTGVVSNHAAPPGSDIMPVTVIADFRGVGISSRIWVVGDGGTTLDQYDNLGNALSATVIGATLTPLAADFVGDIWCGSWGNGTIYRFRPVTMSVINTYSSPPACLGLEFDSFGRLWTTARFPAPTPSEIRRHDPSTGSLEVFAQIGQGTQSALSTRYHHALVVDQLTDDDGDGELNIVEIAGGTSPWDPQSSSFTSLTTTGSTTLGAAPVLSLATNASNMTLLTASTSLFGLGLQFAGVTGSLYLEVTTMLLDPSTGGPLILSLAGPFAASIPLPSAPGAAGSVFHFQGLTLDPAQIRFSNVASIKLY